MLGVMIALRPLFRYSIPTMGLKSASNYFAIGEWLVDKKCAWFYAKIILNYCNYLLTNQALVSFVLLCHFVLAGDRIWQRQDLGLFSVWDG